MSTESSNTMRMRCALSLAVLAFLGGVGPTHAGPTAKRSRWVTETLEVHNLQPPIWGTLVAVVPRDRMRTLACPEGELPLLMRAKATLSGLFSARDAALPPEALGWWRLLAQDLRSGHAFEARTRGVVLDASSDAGIPWVDGLLQISTAAAGAPIDPAVRSAYFAVELTLACGRVGDPLVPMDPARR